MFEFCKRITAEYMAAQLPDPLELEVTTTEPKVELPLALPEPASDWREITVRGKFVNNDGWTYGLEVKIEAKGVEEHKVWLIDPKPNENETHLTYKGAPVTETEHDRDFDGTLRNVFVALQLNAEVREALAKAITGTDLHDVVFDVTAHEDIEAALADKFPQFKQRFDDWWIYNSQLVFDCGTTGDTYTYDIISGEQVSYEQCEV